MNIKSLIEEYRSPNTKDFILSHPIDKVYSAIEDIQNSNSFTGDLDFELRYFTGTGFTISLIRLSYKQPFPSIINGTISSNGENQTALCCTRQKSVLGQVFIWICLLIGAVFLFKFIFSLKDLKFLLFSILFFLVFPYLTMWYALMTESVLYERFEIYLRKTLK